MTRRQSICQLLTANDAFHSTISKIISFFFLITVGVRGQTDTLITFRHQAIHIFGGGKKVNENQRHVTIAYNV